MTNQLENLLDWLVGPALPYLRRRVAVLEQQVHIDEDIERLRQATDMPPVRERIQTLLNELKGERGKK